MPLSLLHKPRFSFKASKVSAKMGAIPYFSLALLTSANWAYGAELPAYEYKVLPNTGHAGNKHIVKI